MPTLDEMLSWGAQAPAAVAAAAPDQTDDVTRENLAELAATLRTRGEYYRPIGEALAAVVAGQPFATSGSRNATMMTLTREILEVYPYAAADSIVDLFTPSLQAMVTETEPPTERELRSMIDRFQSEKQAKAQTTVWLSGAAARTPRPANTLAPEPVAVTTLGQRLRAKQAQGPRHPTGIDPLDGALRGGLRAEKVMVIGGAPGAGKTTLAVQIGDHFAAQGVAVGFLANDEEPSGIDERRMQAIGIYRAHAEEPNDATIAKAEAKLGPLPFEVFDACNVEDVFEMLAARYPNLPRAVIVDSLQTARTRQSSGITSLRERIDDVLQTAKRFARATRAILICTSELARGSYRSADAAQATEDIAAFKESGGIEYAAHVLLVLRSEKDGAGLVNVTMPKNRTGERRDFALYQSFETARFAPMPQAIAETRKEARAAEVEAKLMTALSRPDCATGIAQSKLLQFVSGKRQDNIDALTRLEKAGTIRRDHYGRGITVFPVTAQPPPIGSFGAPGRPGSGAALPPVPPRLTPDQSGETRIVP